MEPVPTELIVRRVSAQLVSPMGHPYVEADVDGGTIAFWGSATNMSNIQEVQRTPTPFRIICDCINSNWNQHDRWVPERGGIYVIEATPGHSLGSASGRPPTARAVDQRRVQLSCRKCGHARELTDEAFQEFVTTHGLEAERNIPPTVLGRLRCQQCGAHDVRQVIRTGEVEEQPTRAATKPRRFETCSACGGDGGADNRCWKCWGRGFLDSAAD